MAEKELEKFDSRTLKHQLKRKEITQKDYQSYLKSLPDESNNVMEVSLEEETIPPFQQEGDDEETPTFSAISEVSE